jgi:large subunit ribosomal protein L6
MSRIGKKPIEVPEKVKLTVSVSGTVLVEGPKGKLSYQLPDGIKLAQEGKTLTVSRTSEDRKVRALHGTSRALINNMLVGCGTGFVKDLEISGVGFKAAVKGDILQLNLGYSHAIDHPIPAGIKVTVAENTKIKVEGHDKHLVGQVAADIRNYYPPEPYKGKGVKYAGEVIRRKEGKTVQ